MVQPAQSSTASPLPTISINPVGGDRTAHLSPPQSARSHASIDAPASPVPTVTSVDGASSMMVPPSPTLSHTSSVAHFPNTTSLRDNNPNKLYTPGLLSPTDTVSGVTQHGRKQSWSSAGGHSSAEDASETEVSKSHKGSSTTAIEEKGKRRETEDSQPEAVPKQQLPQDADTDPAPFPFKPYELAHMLDPKNLNVLVALGGSHQLLRGLATDENHGIITEPPSHEHTENEKSGLAPGHGDLHEKTTRTPSMPVPGIFVTSPEDDGAAKTEGRPESFFGKDTGRNFPLHASLEERRRVYGANVIPQRPSKTLLQLMWAALQDKVLVRICRNFSLCLTQIQIS